jgi:cell division protein FtsL
MRFKFRSAVFILVIFVALAGIHLYIYTQNVSLQYRVADLKARLSAVQSENRELGSRVAQRENLSQVEKTAKEKMGMFYPEKINYILAPRDNSRKAPPAGPGTASSEANP